MYLEQYLSRRIDEGKLKYDDVVAKHPKIKKNLDNEVKLLKQKKKNKEA